MPASVSSGLWSLLPTLGVPLILVLFYFDGLIIGKIAPPAALFVSYVAIAAPSWPFLAFLVAAAVAASTLGQWTVYRGMNHRTADVFGIQERIPYLDRLPFLVRRKVGRHRMAFVSRTFDRFGGAALCLINALPGIRSLIAIPAGLSRYPVRRFLIFSSIGNLVYVVLLVGVASGLLRIV